MRIIDSQVHIWGASTAARPWPQGTVAHRAEPFGVDDLIPEMDRAGIAAAVLVPPSWEGDRNDVALAAVQRYPGRFCVMGRLPLTVPMSSEELTEWHSQPGMLGARLTFNRDPGPLTNGSIEWLWDAAERVHLPIMLFAPNQTHVIADIAQRYPELRLVIDHCGLQVGLQDPQEFRRVLHDVAALARYANIAVKLSALPCYTTEGYPFKGLHDGIAEIVSSFGARRSFWGSNLTRLPCTYRESVLLFTEALGWPSREELRLLMGEGLAEWLDWHADDVSPPYSRAPTYVRCAQSRDRQ